MSLNTVIDWVFLAAELLIALAAVIPLYRRLLRNYDPRHRFLAALQALADYGGEIVVLLVLWQWQGGAPFLSALSTLLFLFLFLFLFLWHNPPIPIPRSPRP